MTGASPLRAIVFDLDGVIRHYDRDHEAEIERRHGMEPGHLLELAYGGSLGQDLMCGRIDVETFVVRFGAEVGPVEAARELVDMRAELDRAMVELVTTLRTQLTVALLTNGTTRTRHELASHGLSEAFDRVFNSAEIGLAKPTLEVYDHVSVELDVSAEHLLFIDDKVSNVDGAVAAGWHGHHYRDRSTLHIELDRHGVAR